MAGVNKAIVVGRLGRDPEIRFSQQGTAVCSFSVATSEEWNDKATGEKKERAEWHRITVFGKQGENCEKFLSKGRQVYLEGRLQTSDYEKDGQKHYRTDIVANIVQFLGDKGGNQENNIPQYKQKQANTGYQQQQSKQDQEPYNPAPGSQGNPPDDDIPF